MEGGEKYGAKQSQIRGIWYGPVECVAAGGEGVHFGESGHLNSPAGVGRNCRSIDLRGETCLTCLKNGDQRRGWSRVRLRESEWG